MLGFIRSILEVLKMKKFLPCAVAGVAGAAVCAGVGVAAGLSASRRRTIASIKKLAAYPDGYGLYSMDVRYGYDLDAIIASGIHDDQSMIDAFANAALPLMPVKIRAPYYGCTAFTMKEAAHGVRMGRSYDFACDTSAMIVRCAPKNGYRSVATAALDNLSVNDPQKSLAKKAACLLAPFVCLDGMNEKGVCIAVLTLDSDPVFQQTGKPMICTSLAIRLVLDRAATAVEAVELLNSYDMFASSGRDYHFYITDATGDGWIVEYDCDSPGRKMVATKTHVATNFYIMHKDKVLPNRKNGHYGHGRERYDKALEVLGEEAGSYGDEAAWRCLRAVAQDPTPADITSNTQWSIVYNPETLTAQIAIRRHWGDVIAYGLGE